MQRVICIWAVLLFLFLLNGGTSVLAAEEVEVKGKVIEVPPDKGRGEIQGYGSWMFGQPERSFRGTCFKGPQKDDSIRNGLHMFTVMEHHRFWEFETWAEIELFFQNKKLAGIRLTFNDLLEDLGTDVTTQFIQSWVDHVLQYEWYDVYHETEGLTDWSTNGKFIDYRLRVADHDFNVFKLMWEDDILRVTYFNEEIAPEG